jgi:hypothetical protein
MERVWNVDTSAGVSRVCCGGNFVLPTGRPDVGAGAVILTETNVSPVFFDENQTQVDLDVAPPSGQRPDSID